MTNPERADFNRIPECLYEIELEARQEERDKQEFRDSMNEDEYESRRNQ